MAIFNVYLFSPVISPRKTFFYSHYLFAGYPGSLPSVGLFLTNLRWRLNKALQRAELIGTRCIVVPAAEEYRPARNSFSINWRHVWYRSSGDFANAVKNTSSISDGIFALYREAEGTGASQCNNWAR